MTIFENIPQELRQLLQWVAWKFGKPRADGKRPKLPINPHTGKAAKSNDPTTWGDFATAQAAVSKYRLEGVGFMFAEGGGYTGIDFDNCIVGGTLTPQVAGVLGVLNSYAEISPSGEGVKVWVKGAKPAFAGCVLVGVLGCKQIEIYDAGRYFTVTGNLVPGMPVTVAARQAELDDLCRELWPTSPNTSGAVTVCQSATPSSAVSQLGGAQADVMARCWACIQKMRKSVSGKVGHNDLLAAACTCFRFALNDDQARVILARFNAERCTPAWDAAELERKLRVGFKKVEAAGQFGELLHKSSKGTTGTRKRWHNHLPGWILDLPRLRPIQRVILQAIADRCDKKPIDAAGSLGGVWIGYDTLAAVCGSSPATVKRHVKQMISMGMLVRVSKGGIRWDTGEILANEYAIPGKFEALNGVSNCSAVINPPTGLPDGGVANCYTVGGGAE